MQLDNRRKLRINIYMYKANSVQDIKTRSMIEASQTKLIPETKSICKRERIVQYMIERKWNT